MQRFVLALLLLLGALRAHAETPALDAEFLELQQLEARISAQHASLPSGGPDTWGAQLAALDPAEREKITASVARKKDLTGEPGKLGALMRQVKAHSEALGRFQEDYDNFNDRKLDYLLDRYQHFAATALEHARAQSLSPTRLAALEQLVTEMKSEYDGYHANRDTRGTPLDRVRGHHLMRYMKKLEAFAKQAGRPFRTTGESIMLTLDPVGQFLGKVEQAGAFLPSLPGLFGAINRGSGLLPAIRNGMRRQLAAWGINHNVEGRENIVRASEPGVVNVYVAMHPNGMLDVASIAELNIPRAALVLAVAPPVMKDKFLASRDLIVVKQGGGNPVTLIKEKLAAGKLDGLIIFPQGGAVGAAYEERQVQRSFPLLLSLLRKDGLRLRIIPISQPYSHRLGTMLGPGERPLDRGQMVTRVHEPIPPEVVDLILASGDRTAVSSLLRQGWIDSVTGSFEPGKRVVGMPSIADLRGALDKQLVKRTRCGFWRLLLSWLKKEREPLYGAPLPVNLLAA